MNKTKYMVFSGFLGAGKTTSMLAFAKWINSRYCKAAILANDLGAGNIVDAEFTATSDVLTTSISGNCICYQHENLMDKLHQLKNNGAEVIFSDIPGCGIGALDNVYLQMVQKKETEEFDLMPFTCIVDPERLKMLMEGTHAVNLPEEMKFLLNAQMMEADVIVLNKTDMISQEEQEKDLAFLKTLNPDKPVFSMSARTGEGVAAVVDYLMTHVSAAQHREIGYGSEAFITAERMMSWYNRRVYLEQKEEKAVDFNEVISDLFEGIREKLRKDRANVPHLKAFASGKEDDFFKASMLGVDYPVVYDHRLTGSYWALPVIINARAVATPQQMSDAVDEAIDGVAEKYHLKTRTFFLENFAMMEDGKGNGGKASKY